MSRAGAELFPLPHPPNSVWHHQRWGRCPPVIRTKWLNSTKPDFPASFHPLWNSFSDHAQQNHHLAALQPGDTELFPHPYLVRTVLVIWWDYVWTDFSNIETCQPFQLPAPLHVLNLLLKLTRDFGASVWWYCKAADTGAAGTMVRHQHQANHPATANIFWQCQLVRNEKANKYTRLKLCLHKFL